MMSTSKPKTIVYDYLFNYFGKDKLNGDFITGASISLAIHIYKDDTELKFTKEPKAVNNTYLSNVFSVSFDRNKLFKVTKNLYADNLFRLIYGWTKIDFEVVGYSLDKLVGTSNDVLPDCPKELLDFPVSEPMNVSKEEFIKFLTEHIDDFDISDNQNAQCPSISFLD